MDIMFLQQYQDQYQIIQQLELQEILAIIIRNKIKDQK